MVKVTTFRQDGRPVAQTVLRNVSFPVSTRKKAQQVVYDRAGSIAGMSGSVKSYVHFVEQESETHNYGPFMVPAAETHNAD